MSFLTDMLYGPAMEADDITGDATDAASGVTGGDGSGDDNSGDIDLNTDDILGTSDPDNNTDEDNNPTDDSGDGTDPDNPDGGGDVPEGEGDLPEDLPSGEEKLEESGDDEFNRTRKYKLWKNFRALYSILEDAVDLVSKYIPGISDAKTILVMDNVKESLMDAKKECYSIMTTQYQSTSYPQLQKKYIAINHVYDLETRELEKYFDEFRDKFH